MKRQHLLTVLAALALLVCCILPGKAEAATVERSGSCGTNVTYTLDSDGVLTISGTGAMNDYSYTPWYNKDWEDEIDSVVVASGVTYIGNNAFYGCYNLVSASLPSTVTKLGENVFSGCTDLTTVNIPSGITSIPRGTFSNCRALTAISLPSSVTAIGEYAFSSAGLTTFTVSSKVTEIGDRAFYGCTSLTKITVNSSNSVYASDSKGVLFNKSKTTLIAAPGALSGSYSIPSTVTTIGPYAFYSCLKLTGVTISSKVSDIGDYAFYSCSLTSVTIPGNVISIGDSAFRSCTLTSLTIQSGVTSIGDYAFYGCSDLATVTVPDTVISIGSSAFTSTAYWTNQPDGLVYIGCFLYGVKGTCPTSVTVKAGTVAIGSGVFAYQNGITSVSLPTGLKSIGYRAFYECTGLTSVSIPSTVTELGEAAFAGCENITSITVPSGVTVIPNTLFSCCYDLSYVSIPSGVTEIGTRAFWKCALSQVSLPGSLVTIGDYAFSETDLTSIDIPNSVTTIGTQAFYYCPLTTVRMGSGVKTIGEQAFLQYETTPSVYISDLAAWLQIDFDYGSNPMNGGPLYINGTQATSITVPSSVTQIKDYALQGCPSTVTRITLHSQITAIGNSAFSECSGITSVTIPSKVTTIGSYAFSYCTGLTSVTIPYGVTSIGSDAFYGCSGLTSVTVPDSVTSIGLWAFAECTSLESLKLSKNLTAIPGRLIARNYALTELTVPEGVTQIDAYAFGPSSLAAITLPSTVTTIDTNAFYEVDGFSHVYYTGSQSQWSVLSKPAALADVTVHCNVTGSSISKQVKCSLTSSCCTLCGESITAAPKEAASHNFVSGVCTVCGVDQHFTYTADSYYGGIKITGYTGSASTLVIPDTIEGVQVRTIAENAFKNCTTLTDVTVPDSVNYIGSGAFSGCTKLSRITLPFVGYSRASNYPLGYIFGTSYNSGCTYTKQVYRYSATSTSSAYYYIPKSLTSVTITDGSIKYGAFYNCSMLTAITLPQSSTAVGDYAFYYCSGLKELTIPEGVTSIGTYAFYYCSKLTHIVLPKTLKTVSQYAFNYCSKLKQVCYTGTETQRSAMSITSSGNTYLTSATWFYDAVDAVVQPHETCTTIAHICNYCERTVWTETKATPTHNFADATCTTPKTCTVCSATEGEALGHSGDLWFEIVAPTCTTTGMKARICSVCNATQTAEVAALGHSYRSVVTDPTCTEKGYTTSTCSACGDTKVTDYVDATGHSFGQWAQTKAPTCAEEGEEERACACGAVETQPVAALGHSYDAVVTDPTCTEKGYTTSTCSACGDTEVTGYVDATGHSFGAWTQIKAPGCTEAGEESRSCACGETETQAVAALGHSFDSVVTAPTCTEQGYTTNTCSVCGEVTVTDYVDATGHSWSAWIQTAAPTCTAEGSQLRFCNCGARETEAVEKLPHSFDSVVTAPTCTEQGYTTNTCTVCGEVTVTDYVDATGHSWSAWIQTVAPTCTAEGSQLRFCNCGTRETEAIEKLPHSYVDGVCTACGASEYFRMVLTEDGQVTLSLTQDLYVDLAGFDLTGTITTNGYKVYGMDSTTDSYSCENIGSFTCVDENGDFVVPERFYTDSTGKQYMSIRTEGSYSFHCFWLGVTHMSLDPEVIGVGYKAAVFGDEMVLSQLDEKQAFSFCLQLEDYRPVYRHIARDALVSGKSNTLRLRGYDVENYGEAYLYVNVSITFSDGTRFDTNQKAMTLRSLVETVNENHTAYSDSQLADIKAMLEKYEIVKKWNVSNLI